MYLSIQKILDVVCNPIKFRFDQSNTSNEIKSKHESKDKQDIEKAGIYCKYCMTRISHPSHAIEMQGAHYHVFTNPEGIRFEIGLYDQVECLPISPAILEHSWFAGYAWRIIACPECTSHLGWSFSKHHSPDFYGLILDRLQGQV